MYTNVFLQFSGRCREAFAFYAATFHSEIGLTMTYAEAPGGSPVPQEFSSMIMHTSMPLGPVTLMGCDSPKAQPMGGFRISIDVPDNAEVHRLYEALCEDGSVEMALGPTFWSPLFAMVTDKFGVGWMLSITNAGQ